MAVTLLGPHDWRFSGTREGHRTYEIWWLLEVTNTPPTSITDPSDLVDTPGLPAVGSSWSDLSWITGSDDWAFCMPEFEVEPWQANDGEAPTHYRLKNTFDTLGIRRCQDTDIKNPLNEPHELSGSWVTKRIVPFFDRDGKPYTNRAGEIIGGPQTEIDDNDWEINISFNSPTLNLAVVNSLRHRLNNAILWGLPAETVKFSKYGFVRRYYGICFPYYNLRMSFAIRADWTQNIQEIGSMEVIDNGDPDDPDDWVRSKDVKGENVPIAALDVDGKRIVDLGTQTPNIIVREPYYTGNLLLLGIPPVL